MVDVGKLSSDTLENRVVEDGTNACIAPEPLSSPASSSLCNADSDAMTNLKRSPARKDRRLRPGRGCLRTVTPTLSPTGTPSLHACYQVAVSKLPLVLQMHLPRFARCADDSAKRKALPRRTRVCFVQPYVALSHEEHELVEWRPGSSSDAPTYFKVAVTPDALPAAHLVEVSAQDAETLVRELVHTGMPSPCLQVAPAYFLTEEMRAMIAPGVSFDLLTPDTTPPRRSSPTAQVAIPHHIAQMPLKNLHVSARTIARLWQAGIITVGQLLSLEENELVACLGSRELQAVVAALFEQQLLPASSDTPGATMNHAQPISETFYFFPSNIVYEDKQQGALVMVYTSLFADRLNGARSGPVDTLWLKEQQIDQAMAWSHEMEQLDTFELRVRVHEHALACGAELPSVVPSAKTGNQHRREEYEREERCSLVRFKDRLFVSCQDFEEGKKLREKPIRTVLRVLERYQHCPDVQPIEYRLEPGTLCLLQHWITEDRKRQFREAIYPARTIIKHPVWVQRRAGMQDKMEFIGYGLIIGVLASTPIPEDLVIRPRQRARSPQNIGGSRTVQMI